MSVLIEVHKDSWTGEREVFQIPNFVLDKGVSGSISFKSDPPINISYDDVCFVITEQMYQIALSLGLSNVKLVGLNQTESKWFINETQYIAAGYNTDNSRYQVGFFDAQGEIISINIGDSQIRVSPSFRYDASIQKYSTLVYSDINAVTLTGRYTFNVFNLGNSYDRFVQFVEGVQTPSTDPYDSGGTSGTGGGTGTFSSTGDSIEFPGLPTLSAVSTGFITLFNPSIAQMQSLANYMWSDLFDIDTFKKIFADPMDCILGLSIVPVAVPNGGTAEVKVGNISTGVSMTVASTQYVEVDCGTLNVKEYWGSYLDYDPYTKAEIYLPYCGTHPIAVDDIMGKSVHVKYHVDILSGACVAYVKCGSSVLYSFIGQCTSSIPITGNDWTNVVNGAISIASAIGSMVATGGATAPLVMPGVASTAVNSLKPSVEKSGSMSGTGGMLAVQTPYLILTRPRQALPKNQNTYTGYPSFIKEKLSDLKGYTEVAEIRLSGVDATDAELDEIVGLLKGGVII